MNTDTVLFILGRLDGLKPYSKVDGKIVKNRGYSIRAIILLLNIVKYEGETQAFFSAHLEWTRQNIHGHIQVLHDDGFILFDDDERDVRGQAKRIYLVDGVREYLQELLS